MKNKTLFKSLSKSPVNLNKRTTLKWLGGSLLLASMGAKAVEKQSASSVPRYHRRLLLSD